MDVKKEGVDLVAEKAVSPDLGERVAANNLIKEVRLHGSPEDKHSLMAALTRRLLDGPEKAIYAADALIELGDPAAIDEINSARNFMDTRGKGLDAWEALGAAMQQLRAMGRSKGADDAIRKLDAEKPKPAKVR